MGLHRAGRSRDHVGEIESRARPPVYVALRAEVEMFDSRFAGVIDRLQVDHVGRVRNVHFRRLLLQNRKMQTRSRGESSARFVITLTPTGSADSSAKNSGE